jgi:hypothetical protein
VGTIGQEDQLRAKGRVSGVELGVIVGVLVEVGTTLGVTTVVGVSLGTVVEPGIAGAIPVDGVGLGAGLTAAIQPATTRLQITKPEETISTLDFMRSS